MPISRQAIEDFLNKPVDLWPVFKNMSTEELHRVIYDCTGQPFTPKTTPRPHQLVSLAFALFKRRSLLFLSMRLGKTHVALNYAAHLRRAGLWRGQGLVIAHSPIALDVWEQETATHSNLHLRRVRSNPEELFDAVGDASCDLVIVPWSTLQVMFTEKRLSRHNKPKLYPSWNRLAATADCFDLAIIDEIHTAKDHLSLRFMIGAALVRNCKFRIGLSGTPFGRDPFHVWSQAFLIDGGKTLGMNYYFFEAAFGSKRFNPHRGRDEFKFDKEKQVVLEQKLATLAISYRLEEVQQTAVFTGAVRLRMTAAQTEAYNSVFNKLLKLGDGMHIEILNSFIRLRQISSGFLPFVDNNGVEHLIHFDATPKLVWLEELVSHLPDDMQIVIFHEFTRSGELISEQLTRSNVSHDWLYGGTKDSSAVVKRFQNKQVRILVANTAKGGMAINLPGADYLLFYESPTSPIIRQQAEARPMARGSRPLVVDDLVVSGVEERILSFIREGKDLMQSIVHHRRELRSDAHRRPRLVTRP